MDKIESAPDLREWAMQTNSMLQHWEMVRLGREDKIIDDLVSRVRNHKISYEELYAGIAKIAELRSIEAQLEAEMRELQSAVSREVGHG